MEIEWILTSFNLLKFNPFKDAHGAGPHFDIESAILLRIWG